MRHLFLIALRLLMPKTRNAPSRAKSDLKKQLALHNVRKSIATAILSSLGLADHDMSSTLSSSRSETRRPASSLSHHRVRDDPPRPNSVLSSRSQGHGEGKDGIPRLLFKHSCLHELNLCFCRL